MESGNLKSLLTEKKETILDNWRDKVISSYPYDSSGFLKKRKDRITNPVGYAITQGTKAVFEAFLTGAKAAEAASLMEDLLKIRAVQDFRPSQALGFVFSLKKAVREVLSEDLKKDVNGVLTPELIDFEDEIDQLGLCCFDVYVKSREKVWELRANDFKNRIGAILKKAMPSSEIPSFADIQPAADDNL